MEEFTPFMDHYGGRPLESRPSTQKSSLDLLTLDLSHTAKIGNYLVRKDFGGLLSGVQN